MMDGVRRAFLVLIAVVGVVLAAVGVWFSTDRRPASFGWTAYAPLSSAAYPIVVGPPAWAVALIALGCLAVGSAVTLLVVHRRPR
jgi:heme/copper-type cytochrome/quinol oxidase subunit 1